MSITLVTGTLGGGKTTFAVYKMKEALEAGKVVVTNIATTPTFAYDVGYAWNVKRMSHERRHASGLEYESRFLHTDSLEEVKAVRVHGVGEFRALVALDEAHNWLNSRMWASDEDRKDNVRWATQTRKLGFEVLLISQLPEAIDKQVRGAFEYEVHCRNLKHFKLAGIPLFPFNVTLAIKKWHNGGVIVKRESFRPRRFGKYFDSWALSHGLEEEPDGGYTWMPKVVREERADPPPTHLIENMWADSQTEETPATEPPTLSPLDANPVDTTAGKTL